MIKGVHRETGRQKDINKEEWKNRDSVGNGRTYIKKVKNVKYNASFSNILQQTNKKQNMLMCLR